jgi:hypothetical protein
MVKPAIIAGGAAVFTACTTPEIPPIMIGSQKFLRSSKFRKNLNCIVFPLNDGYLMGDMIAA